MRKTIKRLFSLLVAMVMAFSLLPAAFAEDIIVSVEPNDDTVIVSDESSEDVIMFLDDEPEIVPMTVDAPNVTTTKHFHIIAMDGDLTIGFKKADSALTHLIGTPSNKNPGLVGLEYSIDGDPWVKFEQAFTLKKGQTARFRNSEASVSDLNKDNFTITSTNGASATLGGELGYLLAQDGNATPGDNAFSGLFAQCDLIRSAKALVLPTASSEYAYEYMFYDCSGLTSAPELKETQLTKGIYRHMFEDCSSLSALTVNFTSYNVENCVSNLLNGVSATGTLTAPAELLHGRTEAEVKKAIYAPSGWTIETTGTITHQWATAWSYDFKSHWNACTVKNCDAKGNQADHSFVNNVCSVCQFVNSDEDYFSVSVTGAPLTIGHAPLSDVKIASAIGDPVPGAAGLSGVECSKDKMNWTDFTTVDAAAGETVFFRNKSAATDLNIDSFTMTGKGKAALGGNIMYLLAKDGNAVVSQNSFANLFGKCSALTDAENLIMGDADTVLAENCCAYMFYSCKNLETAPELPSMKLAKGCYRHMFDGCASLTSDIVLPATSAKKGAYAYMFKNCTDLTHVTMALTTSKSRVLKDLTDTYVTSAINGMLMGANAEYNCTLNVSAQLLHDILTIRDDTRSTGNWHLELIDPSASVRHTYGKPKFDWVKNNQEPWTVTYHRSCEFCKKKKSKQPVDKFEVTNEPGYKVYTATVTIRDLAATSEPVVYTSVKKEDVDYKITYNGKTKTYKYGTVVTATSSNSKIVEWYANKKLVATGKKYCFTVTEDVKLTTKDTTVVKPIVTCEISPRTAIEDGKTSLTVTARWTVPNGYTFVEAGIRRGYGQPKDKSDLTTKNASSLTKPNGTYKYTIKMSAATSKKQFNAIAYLTYKDKNGKKRTIDSGDIIFVPGVQ